MENYLMDKLLGTGVFGTVHKVRSRRNGRWFALKVFNYGMDHTTVREISSLKALQGHPHIIEMEDCFEYEGSIAILMPCMRYTLQELTINESAEKSSLKLPLSFVAHFSVQVAKALSYMHGLNIIHRDLSPNNVLLTENLTVKVADFGLTRQTLKWMTGDVVALAYRAPELYPEPSMDLSCTTEDLDEISEPSTSQHTSPIDTCALECMTPELLSEPTMDLSCTTEDLDEVSEPSTSQYTSAIDMWSLGVMIAGAMERKLVFQSDKRDVAKQSSYVIIVNALCPSDHPRATSKISTKTCDLTTLMPTVMQCDVVKRIVLKLLTFYETDRLSAHELLQDSEWLHVAEMTAKDKFLVKGQVVAK